MQMRNDRFTFEGHIAGFGTELGVRIVIGSWAESPFGHFSDVMLQTARNERVLLAPTADVAEFVSSTYHFDRVVVGPTYAKLTSDSLALSAPELDVVVGIDGPAKIDRLLRLIPKRLAVAPWWLRAIDPIAARVVPGAHTSGTAGNGRREYYGVRRSSLISSAVGRVNGTDIGGLAPLHPPVQFGFSSAPKRPQIVTVTTHIDRGLINP